jgi:hypothetical protein
MADWRKVVGRIATGAGGSIGGVSVTVNKAGTSTKATLKDNKAGTEALANPFDTDANGVWTFFIDTETLVSEDGEVDIVFDKSGLDFSTMNEMYENIPVLGGGTGTAEGLSVHDAVACATTANITLSGEQTLDGILTSTDRVLVKDQTDATENGIYVSAAGAWARSTDFDEDDEAANSFVFITGGTTLGSTGWVCTNNLDDQEIGVDDITFAQFSSVGYITAGTGLTKTGNEIAISDPELLALAGLTFADDQIIIGTGAGTVGMTSCTAFAQTILDDADAAAVRATIGAGTGSGDVTKVGTPVDNEIGVWTGDGTLEGDTNFQWDSAALIMLGTFFIKEQANAAADKADYGQIWVKSGAPNELYFTTDAGVDQQMVYAGGAFHDGFSDFVANEHIDHTTVTLSAGNGMSGGGTIAANRTFSVGPGTGIAVSATQVSVTGVLEDLFALTAPASDGQFIVATGVGAFAYESGATVLTSLGLGTGDSPAFTGLTLSGLTDNRVVVAGTAGVLEDDANLTWDATVFTVTGNLATDGTTVVLDGSTSVRLLSAAFVIMESPANRLGLNATEYMQVATTVTTGITAITHTGSAPTVTWTANSFDFVGAMAADALTLSDVLTFSDGATIDNTDANTLTITETNIALTGIVGITGATNIVGAVTVGVSDTGHDVKLWGATAGAFFLFDQANDAVVLQGGATKQMELRFMEDTDNGAHYTAFKAHATMAAAITYILPDADSTGAQYLTSDGSGNLSWGTPGGAGDVTAAAVMTNHSIIRGDGGAKGVQDSAILIDDSDNVSAMGTLGCGAITSAGASTFYGASTGIGFDAGANLSIAVTDTTGVTAITHAGSGVTVTWTAPSFDFVGAIALDAVTVSDVLTFSDGATIDNTDATTLTITETNIALTGIVGITGATNIVGAVTIGVDDTGRDLKCWGATVGAFMLFDESEDALVLQGGATKQMELRFMEDTDNGAHYTAFKAHATMAAAITYIWPDADSTGTQSLVSDGSGNLSWSSAGSGDVTKVGTPVDDQVGVWTGDGTLKGDTGLTWDDAILTVTGNLGVDGTTVLLDGSTSVRALSAGFVSVETAASDIRLGYDAAIYTKIAVANTTGNVTITHVGGSTDLVTWTAAGGFSFVGAFGVTGAITASTNLIIGDAGTIGSASDTDAMAISAGGVVTLSVQGIADNQVLTVDDAGAADNEYLKFTANGAEGRAYVDVLTDIFSVAMPENTSMKLDPALSADGKYSGVTETGTAGAALVFGDVCYLAVGDSRWELAKADVAATSKGKIGICVLAAAGDGSATEMLLFGKVRADAVFPTFTIGAPVFISAATAGDLTSTAPTGTTDFVVRIIGEATTGDSLLFCPDTTYLELA